MEPWGRPSVKCRLEQKCWRVEHVPCDWRGKNGSSGWRSEECQCLAYGAEAFLSKQYHMLCWSQEVSIRSVSSGVVGIHLWLLELFGWSDLHSSNLYENQLGIDWTCCWFQQYSMDDWLECVPEVWRHIMWDWWDGTRLLQWETLSSGMIVTILQIHGQWASENNELCIIIIFIIMFISSWCKIVKILIIKTNHPVDTTIVSLLLSAQKKMSDLISSLA